MTEPTVTAETVCPRCGLGITDLGSSPGGLTYRCANGHEWLREASSVATPDDPISHPAHYTAGEVECIDAIAAATRGLEGIEAVCVGNIIRYLWRLRRKNTARENAEKAQWYLGRLVEVLGAEKNPPGGG